MFKDVFVLSLSNALKAAGPLREFSRVGMVSAVGTCSPKEIDAFFDLLTEIIGKISGAGGNSSSRISVECCLETETEIRHALFARATKIELNLVAPMSVLNMEAGIADTVLRIKARQELLADPSSITILNGPAHRLNQDLQEPSVGHGLVSRNSEVLLAVLPDTALHNLGWLRPFHDDFASETGLVIAVAPSKEAVVVSLNNRATGTRPLPEFAIRFAQFRGHWRLIRSITSSAAPPYPGDVSTASSSRSRRFAGPPTGIFGLGLSAPRLPHNSSGPNSIGRRSAKEIALLWTCFAATFPFAWADLWARHSANALRAACILLLLLNILAVSSALLGYLDAGRAPFWHPVKLCAIVAALVLYVCCRAARLQDNWTTYRLIAELIRPAPFFAAGFDVYAPIAPRIAERETRQWRDAAAVYHRIVRAAPLPRVDMSNEYLHGVKTLVEDYLRYQRNWHTTFSQNHRSYHKSFVGLGRIAFCGVLLLALLHLIIAWLPALTEHFGAETEHVFEAVFLGGACIFVAIGFAAGILVHQLGFERTASRSELAAVLIERLIESMRDLSDKVTRELLGERLAATNKILLAEQHTGFEQTTSVAIHL